MDKSIALHILVIITSNVTGLEYLCDVKERIKATEVSLAKILLNDDSSKLKKKKNLLELDLNNNFNNNYNPQQETAMNGNNIEQISPQYNNEIIAENESNYQNFGIIRTPDNNINNNTNEINEIEFDNNPQELEENINLQTAKLRDDVNNQYIEMSNLFGKLKMDVIEATQLRNEAEKELQYIRKNIKK